MRLHPYEVHFNFLLVVFMDYIYIYMYTADLHSLHIRPLLCLLKNKYPRV
uniref:Uncharacterized protein n=1 Tax=Lepeophtheirus salmonis TaxID=72036 RepID=A0A0K2VDS9_LEPSM